MNVDWLIHAPWWAAALVVAAGGALFWSGNQRRDSALSRMGIAIALIGVALGAISFAFPSDRQRMESRAKQIISAADKKDWQKMAVLLDEHTSVGTIARDVAVGRDKIVRNTRAQMQYFKITSVSAISTESTQVDTDITVLMKISIRSGELFDEPYIMDCQFDFEKSGIQWLLGKITVIRAGGENGDEVLIHDQWY